VKIKLAKITALVTVFATMELVFATTDGALLTALSNPALMIALVKDSVTQAHASADLVLKAKTAPSCRSLKILLIAQLNVLMTVWKSVVLTLSNVLSDVPKLALLGKQIKLQN